MTEIHGRVFERQSDGGIGAPIAAAELTFRAEDGDETQTVLSESDGTYQVALPPGRYVAKGTKDGYEPFSTDPGYVVVGESGTQTFNVFLKPQGSPSSTGPTVTDFSPKSGHGGTKITIAGTGFSEVRMDNDVVVGDEPATVVEASQSELTVLVANDATTGPVEVTVNGQTGSGPGVFDIEAYPTPGAKEDGPPIHFEGAGQPDGGGASGQPAAGTPLDTSGTTDVLVVLLEATDEAPSDETAVRNDVVDQWDDAEQFYDQASFGDLTVDTTVTADWTQLSGDFSTYYDDSGNNFEGSQRDRYMAEGYQAAVDAGETPEDYDAMVLTIANEDDFIRGYNWGFPKQFEYSPEGIDESISEDLNVIGMGTDSTWDRCAHELGHGLVEDPDANRDAGGAFVESEDVYDLRDDPDTSTAEDEVVASAENFEMMGSHTSEPLFSAFFMTQLEWYDPSDGDHVETFSANGPNPASETFNVVAHGLNRNDDPNRCHVVEIKVSSGLSYFVEIRQQPGGGTGQMFDGNIPLDGASNQGGVIVTKVFTDTVHQNQHMRFLTLMHEQEVLTQGATVNDPAHNLTIEVTADDVQSRPLTCEVTVDYLQNVQPDPSGDVDLTIEPWDDNYQTPDIWVDRQPYGTYDKGTDSNGRPKGNGDKPKPGKVNQLTARLENEGSGDATDVKATFYSVTPPGVGDNGNWAPLQTVDVGTITGESSTDESVDWVPAVGEHTCLKVEIGEQQGEQQFSNNAAQENVFEFEARADSPPEAVTVETAVRNPLDEETIVYLEPHGVPAGYTFQFPHQWLWLGPHEERRFEMTVLPTEEYAWYRDVHAEDLTAGIRLAGYVPRRYESEQPIENTIPSRLLPIGGITADVTPKRAVDLEIGVEERAETAVTVQGRMTPAMANEQVEVDVVDPRDRRRVVQTSTDADGEFIATVDASDPPRGRTDEEDDPVGFVPGTHRVQASTFAADNAAETESNVVHVELDEEGSVGRFDVSPASDLLETSEELGSGLEDVRIGDFSPFRGWDSPMDSGDEEDQ